MNFPVGTVTFKGDTPLDFALRANELTTKKFNGYIIQTVSSNFIEEGAIFFREGIIVACIVECLGVEATFKGNEAVEYFLNQTKGNGFFQCIELTRSQVDLISAFDEKILVPKVNLKSLLNSIPSTFSPKFERTGAQKSVLDSYGLGGLK